MRYKSNLEVPDLSGHFKLLDPPKQIMGHDAPSDPDFEPGCTFWTHDEAAILFNVAKLTPSMWMDIGCRFGWTSAHIHVATQAYVICVDPALAVDELRQRFLDNTKFPQFEYEIRAMQSEELIFWIPPSRFQCQGIVIDGNHDSPEPLRDAKLACRYARSGAVIMFHDFWGKPIRDAVNYLLDQGWSCRIYWTPNGVAVLWRGLPDFVPPDHVRDPQLEAAWEGIRRQCAADFDFSRCV